MDIAARLAGTRVYFDANILVYILEGYDLYRKQIDSLRDAIKDVAFQSFTGEITIMEVLVAPFKNKHMDAVVTYRRFIEDSGAFGLIAATPDIYVKAAYFRAEFNLRPPDAIHVASAQAASCRYFLTNDHDIRTPKDIAVLQLRDL